MAPCRRTAPTENTHSVSEGIELSIRTQGRYDLRPTRPVEYKEDTSDEITSNDYPCESAVESVGRPERRMSSTGNSTSDSEWTTDDDESGYGGSSFVASDSGESVDSKASYAPSHRTGDHSPSDDFSETTLDSPHSSSVAGLDYQAPVLREGFPIAGTGQRESSTHRNSCGNGSFCFDSDDAEYDISDDSSDEGLDFKLPVHCLK